MLLKRKTLRIERVAGNRDYGNFLPSNIGADKLYYPPNFNPISDISLEKRRYVEIDVYQSINKSETNMKYNNLNKIPLIDEFIKTYGKTINEKASQVKDAKRLSNLTIIFISEEKQPKSSDSLFDFSEKNFFFKICGNIIAYHEGNCDALNLSKEERFAMIAHELGHQILVPLTEKDFLKRELLADEMAVQLGLKSHLISGLMKLVSCEGMETINQIQERIDHWSDK